MTESDFFAALRDHLPFFTLTVVYGAPSGTYPYAVELFARKTSYRCAGWTIQECLDSIAVELGWQVPNRVSRAAHVATTLDAIAPAPESQRGKTTSR